MNKPRRLVCQAMGLGALMAPGLMQVQAQSGQAERAATMLGGLVWQERKLLGFGTTLGIKAAHADATVLGKALDESVALLQHLDQILSLFRPDSAVSLLNAEGLLRDPPPELVGILRVAQSVSARSAGAFDVTVQPLWKVFDAAQKRGRLPDDKAIDAARSLVGWQGLIVNDRVLALKRPNMGITLNGIAQGHAADRVRAVLQRHGVQHALIDTGEWATLGRNAHQLPWVLGLADPRDETRFITRLLADGRCVATSADDQLSFSQDHRYHHIFDPHTGRSPLELASVSVLAESGALADALTKVFFVAGPQKASGLAKAWGVDALWVDKQGRWTATAGIRQA
jgi:thiamine biosynthesis lipoprotein